MNAPPVDPSSAAAAAKEPEDKPLFSDSSVTTTDRAATIVGKNYNLSDIKVYGLKKTICKRVLL
jgi:hypothetical protein